MPNIPRRSTGLTPTAPLAGTRSSPNAPRGAFAVPGLPDLSGVQRSVTAIVEDERRKAFNTRLQDADNQLAALEVQQLRDPKTGVLNRRGTAAFTADTDFAEAWQKRASEIEATLTTQEQVDAFRRRAAERYVQAHGQVQAHIAGERQAYTTDVFKTGLEFARDQAITAPDPAARVQALAKTRALIDEYADQMGWAPEVSEQRKALAVSQIHAGVIDRLLAGGQDLAAAKYYADNKPAILGEATAQVERALEEGSTRGESQRQADAILKKSPTQPAALEATKTIADSKVRDATEARIRRYFDDQAQAQRAQRDALMQTATNVIEQTRDPNRVPPATWAQLTVGERGALRNYADELRKGTPVVTNWTTYYDLKSLASADATRDKFLTTNLLMHRAELGDAEFKELTGLQAELRKGESAGEQKLGSYRTVAQVVNDGLAAAGFDPTPEVRTTANKENAQRVALFRRSVDQQIQTLEDRTKKKATAEEVQSIVDNLLVKAVRIDAHGKTSGRSFVFERQPGERLVLSVKDVPVGERARIETALRARRLPVNDAAILRLYTQRLGQIPTFAPPPE